AAPGVFVQLRAADGSVVTVNGHTRGGQEVAPDLPAHIGGIAHAASATKSCTPGPGPGGGPGGGPGSASPDPHRYFTASSATDGGPSFRVRASVLADGTQLVLALPLDEATATLHHLL